MRDGITMGDWNNFYLLIGGTAGTLIGLMWPISP